MKLLLFDSVWWKLGVSWIANVGVWFEYDQVNQIHPQIKQFGFAFKVIKSNYHHFPSLPSKKRESIDLIWFDMICFEPESNGLQQCNMCKRFNFNVRHVCHSIQYWKF